MSAFAYGRAVGRSATIDVATLSTEQKEAEEENKLVTAIAGLIPAEVLAAHAVVLGAASTKDEDGNLIISPGNEVWLGIAVIGLMVGAVLLFLAGHRGKPWEKLDWVRVTIPPVSFLVWAALIGTSVISPFVADVPPVAVAVAAAVAGLAVVALSIVVTPPKKEGEQGRQIAPQRTSERG